MPDMTHPHHRRSIRLPGYDYTQAGAYFITIVTGERAEVFGKITGGEMALNVVGEMARREWRRLPGRFPGLELGEFQIMPNHVHGIIILPGAPTGVVIVGAQQSYRPPVPGTVTLRPGPGVITPPEGVARTGAQRGGSKQRGLVGSLPGAQRDESRQQGLVGSLRPYENDDDGVRSFEENDGDGGRSFEDNVAAGSVGAIVRAYKSAVALRYNRMRLPAHGPLWQRNYYEHIIRCAGDLERLTSYILDNPLRWDIDQQNLHQREE